MTLRKLAMGTKNEWLPAEGLMYRDADALTLCQLRSGVRLGKTVQLEQEAYLSQHPEVKAMLAMFISKTLSPFKRSGMLAEMSDYFTRPYEVLEGEIKEALALSKKKDKFEYKDAYLMLDLLELNEKHYPTDIWKLNPSEASSTATQSSSFISFISSDTTLPIPEPVPTPPPTLEQIMATWVSNMVDKAIYLHVDERGLRYDFAYVEIMKTVEEAMEIPVEVIKEDIAVIYYNAYKMFELDIIEKQRIAAQIAWDKRMRKKLKRTLRMANNFKGYATPPTPKSTVSSHESYKVPPPPPCKCYPKHLYNRYPKDRFGIYLPQDEQYEAANVTVTPVCSGENIPEGEDLRV